MLNPKTNERELAYVARVTEILPIEGADRVEIAKINGWTCMVAKDAFKVNDLGIFFEADAKVTEKEPFLFMEKRHYKVKVQKFFKGTVVSDGLLMSAADFGWEYIHSAYGDYISTHGGPGSALEEGDFLTKKLGITYAEAEDNKRKANSADKYKRMAQRHGKLFAKQPFRWLMKRSWGKKLLFLFFGKKRDKKNAWPAWVVKTDEERIQNLTMKIADFQKEMWLPTEKIDGTSTTFTMKREKFGKHTFYICSRNVVFDKPDKKCFYETNVYTEMAEKYDMEKVLESLLKAFPNANWVTIQGETYGAGIQKRDYSLKEHDFMAFNLIVDKIGRFDTREMAKCLKPYNIPCVPFFEPIELPGTCDDILELAGGSSVIDGLPREGLVFRSLDGSKSFKAVDNNFILKFHS